MVAVAITLVVNSDVVHGRKVVSDVLQGQLQRERVGDGCHGDKRGEGSLTSKPVVLGVSTCLNSGIPPDSEGGREDREEFHKHVVVVTEATSIFLAPLNRRPIVGVEPRTLGEDNQPSLSGRKPRKYIFFIFSLSRREEPLSLLEREKLKMAHWCVRLC